ncbi:MAG TPA: AAA family ATPase [Rhodocyclaceae bacterium]|nr:AAA family ATPase [Rhodocyclaceae bacterium]
MPDEVLKQIAREELAAIEAEAPIEEDEETSPPDWALPAPSVPVFPMQVLDRLLQRLDPEKERRLHTPAKLATIDRGYRQIPRWPGLSEHLHSLRSEFPNFSEALGTLECELALTSVLPPEEFHVPAMLLHGAPGIGKTRMASRLAEVLDLPFAKITASGSQGGFTLVGTSSHWSNAYPGRIFELLAGQASACGVVLIDEVDKFAADERYPVIPALLDLLERDSAKAFRDESLGIEFDASKLIVVLTANDLDTVCLPLRSRVQCFEIVAPNQAQRREIMLYFLDELIAASGYRLAYDTSEIDALASVETMDLRGLQRLIRRAVGQAIATQATHLRLPLPPGAKTQRFGFV